MDFEELEEYKFAIQKKLKWLNMIFYWRDEKIPDPFFIFIDTDNRIQMFNVSFTTAVISN